MSNDLISRRALKKAVENLVAGGEERLKDYYENGSKSEENEWIGGVYDAWELINNAPTVDTTCPNCDSGYAQGYSDGYLKGKEERPQGEWISVSERLPKLFEVVLVTDEYGIVFEYERRPSDDYDVNMEWSFLGRNIIAWMPLPEAYKEGGAE